MIDETETGGWKSCTSSTLRTLCERAEACRKRRLQLLRRETQKSTIPKVMMANAASMREEAETIAVKALGFVAADPELLLRFLSITGIEANSIRRAAAEPGFLAGVLQFILA